MNLYLRITPWNENVRDGGNARVQRRARGRCYRGALLVTISKSRPSPLRYPFTAMGGALADIRGIFGIYSPEHFHL